MAAADTGIFEALGKERKTVQQVADACGTQPAATKQLLDCLALCSDCACKQACLNGRDACRAKETPLQSCLARTCDTLCR